MRQDAVRGGDEEGERAIALGVLARSALNVTRVRNVIEVTRLTEAICNNYPHFVTARLGRASGAQTH
jgi:hypothetical protein